MAKYRLITFSSNQISKILLFKNEKEDHNVFHKIIMDQLDFTKEKSFHVFKKLKEKKIVEGINFCPYCKEPYRDKKNYSGVC